jgi:sirohydrochlorin cobaltochelatase
MRMIIKFTQRGGVFLKKTSVLIVAYGTNTLERLEKLKNPIEAIIKKHVADMNVEIAFTSDFMRKKLRDSSGVNINSISHMLQELVSRGYEKIIIQPMLVIPASEYNKIFEALEKYKDTEVEFIIEETMLQGKENIKNAANFIIKESGHLKEDENIIWVGHGTLHESNRVYEELQSEIRKKTDNIFIGTLDGKPDKKDIINKLNKKNRKKVFLRPYLLSHGRHVSYDIFGKQEKSWLRALESSGIIVECIPKVLLECESYIESISSKILKNILT